MSLRQFALLTESKLRAQRSNARRSTGPRTAAGKARSRWNALRHGQWASGLAWSDESLRYLGEDAEEFERLRLGLHDAAGPSDDPLWGLQIEDLARLYWRRSRLEFAWNSQARDVARQTMSHNNAPFSDEGALLLKQLDVVDRAIDRKIRLLLRLRETEERQRRWQERNGGRGETPNVADSDELSNSAEPTGPDEVSQDEAAAPEPQEASPQKTAPPESAANNSNSEERSQNIAENKGEAVAVRASNTGRPRRRTGIEPVAILTPETVVQQPKARP
jgi:hypothetical protein